MYLLLILSLAILSCSGNITSECELESSNSNQQMKARLSEIQSTVFDNRCTWCHSGNPPDGNLDLSSGTSRSELISKNLIIPFNSTESILMKRINPVEISQVMPPSGKISQALIDSIAAWIDMGAIDN
jgi:hypothetical protein